MKINIRKMVRDKHNSLGIMMTEENPDAVYACINYGEAYIPEEIAKRSICIKADIGEIMKQL